jgi:predicted GH43/DUF377 family glycosyl hydrolase
MELPTEVVERELDKVLERFGDRHRDLRTLLAQNFDRVSDRLVTKVRPDESVRLLIGAYATMEFSIQAAALFNPSMVPAPDQNDTSEDECRFVMSLRAVGEGHLSSIEFRSGTVGADGSVNLDEITPFASTGEISPPLYDREMFQAKLDELGADHGYTRQIVKPLDDHFSHADLERSITLLALSGPSAAARFRTERMALTLAHSNYIVKFDDDVPLCERVIFPASPNESQGMEDARFVQFTHPDGRVMYYATYTAFNGVDIFPQMIETEDFTSFRIVTLNGPSAGNKGMALFPRRIGGAYVALSRYDQENIDVMFSDHLHYWASRDQLRTPTHARELVQMGNCGSPIETEAGWLVLTHGVGPMRTYTIGALLLDLNDPTRIIGALDDPLLEANRDERNGYVPNVVYSCGGLAHGENLILPYGFSDSGIRVEAFNLEQLIDRMLT